MTKGSGNSITLIWELANNIIHVEVTCNVLNAEIAGILLRHYALPCCPYYDQLALYCVNDMTTLPSFISMAKVLEVGMLKMMKLHAFV